MNTISNTDDTIDSRDVIARIEELEGEREGLADAVREAHEALEAALTGDLDAIDDAHSAIDDAETALHDWDDGSDGEELKVLQALQEEAEGYAADWHHGVTLIRDSYFVDYCEELMKDIGELDDLPAYIVIDWDATADNMKADYTEVSFDGATYLVR